MNTSSNIRIVSDQGSGRSYIILREADRDHALCTVLHRELSSLGRAIDLEIKSVSTNNWREITSELRELLTKLGIRQAAFVSFGAAGSILQHLCYLELKLVRSVVLIDASTRPHPTKISRLVDWLEKKLPLGLPLRLRSAAFDGAPFLQRIRCPALVVTTQSAEEYERADANVLAMGLPTAWSLDLNPGASPEELAAEIIKFQQVPAKCPQKARAQAA